MGGGTANWARRDVAGPVNTHSKTAMLNNSFIREPVKFGHHYQQTQPQTDRLHHKIKMNSRKVAKSDSDAPIVAENWPGAIG
jgi:hypothetical protein